MERIRLHIKGLSYSQTQSGAYALVLGEDEGERRLPIIIGGFEAQAIAIALEKEMNPPRPLTHDLFKNFADSFGITLREVVIEKLQDGVFFSILMCEKDGVQYKLDARTSDAVALAIRFHCPIYTYPEILEKAGVILKEGGEPKSRSTRRAHAKTQQKSSSSSGDDLKDMDSNQLHQLLDQAVKDENYELAARIRDELDKRSAN